MPKITVANRVPGAYYVINPETQPCDPALQHTACLEIREAAEAAYGSLQDCIS